MNNLLKRYFFWTYSRGCFHYDVMVTLVLLFIFVTPHLWDYGDKPMKLAGPAEPMQVVGDGGRGLIVTVGANEVRTADGVVNANVDPAVLKKALKKALEPVTGDTVFVTRWEPVNNAAGQLTAWRVWVVH